ncbi:hypothetical protein AS033_03985 [Exiguobacterium indicum]|uniref:Uncharacterized protein n=1 Tax=Exiguobacterium indicum TaxID=296995 RepID=A0A0V8GK80_9BACL|nr:hypothetical protein AS033_03985 [Exiguobacterium enclense]
MIPTFIYFLSPFMKKATLKPISRFEGRFYTDQSAYLLTISLPLYEPHALQTRCESFISPQFGHSTIPGTRSLK